jgi:hypothetical protein
MLPITHGERAAWQRRAAVTLVEILDAHKDLPVIVWAVANAGSTLVGRISTLAPAVEATYPAGMRDSTHGDAGASSRHGSTTSVIVLDGTRT